MTKWLCCLTSKSVFLVCVYEQCMHTLLTTFWVVVEEGASPDAKRGGENVGERGDGGDP